jgi:hypothetical protein
LVSLHLVEDVPTPIFQESMPEFLTMISGLSKMLLTLKTKLFIVYLPNKI